MTERKADPPIGDEEFTADDYDKRIKCFREEREEVAYVDLEYKSEWRSTAIRVLHARNTQYTLTGLLMLDVVLLFAQVFLDAHFPPCYIITDNAVCLDVNQQPVGSVYVQCAERPAAVKSSAAIMYVLSLSILILFEIELAGLAITMGPIHFSRHLSYWFDVFIITASVVLEVLLHETEDGGIAGALVFARVWRLIRIGHGLFLTKRRQALAAMVAGEDQFHNELWETDSSTSVQNQAATGTARVSAAAREL